MVSWVEIPPSNGFFKTIGFYCKDKYVIKYHVSADNFNACIQLFRERSSEKNVRATIPKGNMGYDQYTVVFFLTL